MTDSAPTLATSRRRMGIVDSVDELTPDWLTGALRESGDLEGDGRVSAVSSELMRVGQLGKVARLTLTYAGAQGNSPAAIMAKLPSVDEGSRDIGVTLGVYEAEVRFYEQIAPTVAVPVPQVYWSDIESSTGRFTLLIEDLSPIGEPGDMIAGGNVDQAARALTALVGLQGPRWSDPALRELNWLAAPIRPQMMFGGVEPALPIFLDRFAEHLDAEDVALVESIVPHANAWASRITAGPFVVMHGDYRMDNVFFPRDPATPALVFDWQAASLGPPLVDVTLYLGGCLSLEDRRANERELLAEYHRGLLSHGVSGFSFDDLWESYRWSVFYGLMLSVPFSVQLERTERGDQLFAGMVRGYAALARDLDSTEVLK